VHDAVNKVDVVNATVLVASHGVQREVAELKT